METQQEKVYIAVGKNVEEGLGVLKWALNHWSSQPISFIILHINTSSKFFVQTPFGKIPRSSVSDEKLEVFRAKVHERVDKLLNKYMSICCKVEAQVLIVDAYEEPIHKILVEQIAKFGIKKLVMGFKNTRTLSWKPKCDTNEACCVHKHKPDFCELFIVSVEKRLLLKEENGDGVCFVDESGEIVTNFRKKSMGTLKGWLGRKQTDTASNSADDSSPPIHVLSPSNPEVVIHKWEDEAEEVERYIECLLAASSTELEQADESIEQHEVSNTITHQSYLNRTEALRAIEEAEKIVEEKKNEAKAEEERRRKAEEIISLCSQHAGDIEAILREEMAKLANSKEEQDSVREELKNVFCNLTDNKNNLTSKLDQKGELLIKLQSNSIEKSWVEAEMENVESKRVEILQEMEGIRRQKEFARRRLDYYKEREAMIAANNGSAYEYREFSEEELRDATDGFSDKMMIIKGSEGAVYRGRIHRTSVAIKLKKITNVQSLKEFKTQVRLLSQSNHPHIVTMIGVCTDLRCIVFEYMNRGSLHDILFPSSLNSQHLILPWHSRIRIISSLCSALAFLHASQPYPTVHGRLNSSHVLLDHNLTAKITGIQTMSSASPAVDIKALGLLVLQLLTGIQEVGFQEMREVVEAGTMEMVLDQRAGDWPIDLAWEFARIGLRCFEEGNGDEEGVMLMGAVMNEVEYLREEAKRKLLCEGDTPDVFLCPIFQEVMKEPHVAADGFSYELEAINEWLTSGHETSPMTNLKLNNKRLTPNHTLQSLIRNPHRNHS